MDWPLAFLITFRTYATWLHGDERGSVDRNHNVPGTPLLPSDPRREVEERWLTTIAPVMLSDAQREVVHRAILDVCRHRRWALHALNVRTNHVHLVVSSDEGPERVMNTLKSWATRRLTEAGQWAGGSRPWSRHGSTRYLWKPEQVENACRYVTEAQDEPRPSEPRP